MQSKYLLFLFYIILASSWFRYEVAAMYEDEVGKIDWYKPFIGEIKFAHFQKSVAFVATEQNVISSVSVKSGEIGWRRVLFEGEKLEGFYNNDKYLLSTSRNSKLGLINIRFWDTKDGSLLWDDSIEGDTSPQVAFTTQGDVLLLTEKHIERRSLKDGKLIWNKDSNPGKLYRIHVSSASGDIITTTADENTLRIAKYSLTGQKKSEKSIPVKGSKDIRVSDNDSIIIIDRDNNVLSGKLDTESVVTLNIPLGSSSNAKVIGNYGDFFAIQAGDHGVAFQFQKDQVDIVHQTKNGKAFSLIELNGAPYFLSITENNAEFVDLNRRKVERQTIHIDGNHGNIKRAFLYVYNSKETIKYGILGVHDDLSTFFWREQAISWTREESLSTISKAKFMTFPSSHILDSYIYTLHDETDNPVTAFIKRVKSQVQQIKDLFDHQDPVVINSTDTKLVLSKDRFGLRQLIIAMTTSNTIFGIHSERGQLLWSKYESNCDIQDFLITRSSAYYPPEVVVICKQSEQQFVLKYLNPLTGQISQQDRLISSRIEQSILLPNLDSKGNHLLLIVTDQQVSLFPDTIESRDLFQTIRNSTFYYKEKDGILEGYTIGNQIGNGNNYHSIPIWKIPFSKIGEQIVSMSSLNWNEKIYTSTRILGDRTALEKYLNTNMFAVATSKPSSNPTDNSIQFYLIDGVTGRIIFQARHSKCAAPVHIAISENWVVYDYWSINSNRHEISVMELFEEYLDWDGTTYSSFEKRDPTVLQQSYVFPMGIKSLVSTTTAHGISTKQLLIGLSSDQVMAMSKSWLDPRRPQKQDFTNAHKEEGLYPYNSTLPYLNKNIVNYYQKVNQLRGMEVAPAYLESTTLLFCYGVDLFFTRTTPSGGFDLLNPDFNYFMLVVTSVTIFVLTIISNWISKKRDLNRLWK